MAYTKTVWVDDNTPAINASNLNKIEKGIEDAHLVMPVNGTWTPTLSNITITGTNNSAYKYTRIGRLVFVNMKFSGTTGVNITENGTFTLPFTSTTDGVSGIASSANSGEWAEFSLFDTTRIVFKNTMQGITIQISFFYIAAS